MKFLFSTFIFSAILVTLNSCSRCTGPRPGSSIIPPKAHLTPSDFKKMEYTDLKIEDLEGGDGERVRKGSHVLVEYKVFSSEGKTLESTVKSGPIDFLVGRGKLIRAWDEGLLGMRRGGRRRIIAPSKDSHGSEGLFDRVAPNSNLVFDVTLLNIW